MYTATMLYPVSIDSMKEFVKIWNDRVLKLAMKQPGFIRMQLISRRGEVLAMGTWKDKESAEKFMAMGPFKHLMDEAKLLLTSNPTPTVWELESFCEIQEDSENQS